MGVRKIVLSWCPINCGLGFVSGIQISVLLLWPASWESFSKTLQLSTFILLSFNLDPIQLVHRIDMRIGEKVYEWTMGTVKIMYGHFMTLQRLYLADMEKGHDPLYIHLPQGV